MVNIKSQDFGACYPVNSPLIPFERSLIRMKTKTYLPDKHQTYLHTDNSLAIYQSARYKIDGGRTINSRISSCNSSSQSANCLLSYQLPTTYLTSSSEWEGRVEKGREGGHTFAMGLLSLHIPNISDSNPALALLYSHNLHSIYSSNPRRSWGIVGVMADQVFIGEFGR
jgi:hypothetical protein